MQRIVHVLRTTIENARKQCEWKQRFAAKGIAQQKALCTQFITIAGTKLKETTTDWAEVKQKNSSLFLRRCRKHKKTIQQTQQHKNDEQRIALESYTMYRQNWTDENKNDKTNSSFSLRSLEAWYVRMSNWVAEFTQFPRIERRYAIIHNALEQMNRCSTVST